MRGGRISHISLRTLATAQAMSRRVTRSFPASFVRGGTSNGLVINRADLPKDEASWQPILSSAMGSPDQFGRQLDGMGQGISSTSKIMIISKSLRRDVNVDYTFVQVGIPRGDLDMAGNCGNMSSAVGPVAWNGRVVDRAESLSNDGEATVRMFNTNTNKIIHSAFSVDSKGEYDPVGDYSLDGVSGTGSRITLSFIDPSGAKTGKALPTGNPIDSLKLEDGSTVQATLSDIANPGVFVLASEVGIEGDIDPSSLATKYDTMKRLENIRQEGARLMGLDPDVQSVPKIVLVSKPTDSAAIEGTNIVCRALSMQQPHKAVPLTLALNLGSACAMPGTIPAATAVGATGKSSVVIAHASGRLEVSGVVKDGQIESAQLHRTARLLMRGDVFYTIEDDN